MMFRISRLYFIQILKKKKINKSCDIKTINIPFYIEAGHRKFNLDIEKELWKLQTS